MQNKHRESPTPPHAGPSTSAPGLRAAVGIIAGYFGLQLLVGLGFAVAMALAGWLGQTGTTATTTLDSTPGPAAQAWLAVTALGLAATATLWLAHRQWQRWWRVSEPPGLGFVLPGRKIFFALAIVGGVLAPWLGSLLTQWLAGSHRVVQDIQQLGGQTPIAPRVALAIAVVCAGPLVEELLFRGVLLSALLRRWGTACAVLVSSAAFTVIHLPGLDYQWYALPNLLLLALLLVALRLRSGSIWPSVLAHATNNLLAVASWFVVLTPPQ